MQAFLAWLDSLDLAKLCSLESQVTVLLVQCLLPSQEVRECGILYGAI